MHCGIPMTFEPSERAKEQKIIEECVRDVKNWTATNRLLLNDTKTKVAHMTSCFSKDVTPIQFVTIRQSAVDDDDEARNPGVVADKNILLTTHVNNLCRSAYLTLHKIGLIHKYIDNITAERLVHVFVISCLDANNSLLYGLPDCTLAKLQRLQNSVLCSVTRARRDCDIDSLCRELHWLLIEDRIIYKLLLITFKAIHGLTPSYLMDLLIV